jgi:hypothetical protein
MRAIIKISAAALLTGFIFAGSAHAQNTDHYQCYSVAGAKGFTDIPNVKLKDQFGKSFVTVLRPISICAPVHKNNSPVADEVTHLVCYGLQSEVSDLNQRVRVKNQFGALDFRVDDAIALCVPSTKKLINKED